jgi:dihydroflavonol-4-reductase
MELRLMMRSDKHEDHVKHLQFEKAYGDLTDPESLKNACRDVDVVFHVAALFKMWVRDKESLIKNNVDGTVSMVKAALDAGVERFVYTSSVAAIGHREDGVPSDETVDWNLEWTNDLYTKSKHLSCVEVKKFIADGAPIQIAYPSAPIGYGDIKPTPTGQMFVDFVNGKVPVYFDGGFNLVDVDDVGEGHLKILENGRMGEGYILANRNMWLQDIYSVTADIAGVPKPKFKISKEFAVKSGKMMEWIADNVTGRAPVITEGGANMTGLPPHYDNSKSITELEMTYTNIRDSFDKMIKYFGDRGLLKRGKFAKK